MQTTLSGLLLIGAFLLGGALLPAPIPTTAQIDTITDLETAYTRVYETVAPSVVAITADQLRGGSWQPWSTGTGFVVDQAGHILTNYHVVENSDRVIVNFYDGMTLRAELQAFDAASDIAVLRVDLPMDRLTPVTFADSAMLQVGQITLTIGNPFGQNWTLTSGIISALDRTLQGFTNYEVGAVIQTDAAINPGSSGGPLLDSQGRVIGMNAQIINDQPRNAGVGLALPSNLVVRVARELIEVGFVDYSYLGINGTDVDIDTIETYGLPFDLRGVVVTSVAAGGPADQGGLRPDTETAVDVITAINTVPITGFDALVSYLAANTAPGDILQLTVYRDGTYQTVDVILGSRQSQQS